MIKKKKKVVKVRGSTNGISHKYNINSFYYSIENHTQRRFQLDGRVALSLTTPYKYPLTRQKEGDEKQRKKQKEKGGMRRREMKKGDGKKKQKGRKENKK